MPINLERTREQIAADYQATWDAKQRILANPEFMAMLRRRIAELEAKYGL